LGQDPPPLPYLAEKESVNYDISLEVAFDIGVSLFGFLLSTITAYGGLN
jgi:hypothetical protein